ncbi:unnamed protein product [Prunus armeniaca]
MTRPVPKEPGQHPLPLFPKQPAATTARKYEKAIGFAPKLPTFVSAIPTTKSIDLGMLSHPFNMF